MKGQYPGIKSYCNELLTRAKIIDQEGQRSISVSLCDVRGTIGSLLPVVPLFGEERTKRSRTNYINEFRVYSDALSLPLPPKRARPCRLIFQNPFNLLHDLRRDLLHNLHSLAVVDDLINLRGPENDGADIRILRRPC
jgi:hypothetical protein